MSPLPADSDEAGRAFQSEVGHLFQHEAGHFEFQRGGFLWVCLKDVGF